MSIMENNKYVVSIDENMNLLIWEGQHYVFPGQCVHVLFNSFSRQSSHVAGGQRPYPVEIRQIKAALKVYGPD